MPNTLRDAREIIAALPRSAARVVSGADLTREILEDEERNPPFFEISEEVVHVWWGGYDYEISLDQIRTEAVLLGWVAHLTEKSWPLMDIRRLRRFVFAVCAAKGWRLDT